ncbi:MAG TPA: Abortive infection protein AbiEi [Ignavibacteria bacterium]|nr:Abortive infection protein AbiEi [Ignavibacteria bacterium]
MEKLIKIFKKKKGFARMKELREAGIQTREIAEAIETKIIEKIKPGLYKLKDYPFDENESLVSVCKAKSSAVICLLSAAAFYELTTYNPKEIFVAVPHNTDKFRLAYPPLNVYYFIDKYYQHGIIVQDTKSGEIKIYNKEKTIIDLFRYKDKLGEDVFLESLKNYLRSKERKITKLSDMAGKFDLYKKMEPYIKGAM